MKPIAILLLAVYPMAMGVVCNPDEPEQCVDTLIVAGCEGNVRKCPHPDHSIKMSGENAVCECPREGDTDGD